MLQIKLIRLYYYVCSCYSTQLRWQVQRFSPNSSAGRITDEELLTIYLFAVAYGQKQQLRQIYDFIQDYWLAWFPKLGSYQSFVYRLNRLADCFSLLTELLMQELQSQSSHTLLLTDSCPIITCSARRRPKVALSITAKGYCSAKELYYFGCKLHLVGGHRPGHMPLPKQVGFTPANVHDLTAFKPITRQLVNTGLVADKAYADRQLKEDLHKQNSYLLTPPKQLKAKPENLSQFDKAADNLLGKAVSAIRQPIESLVNWLQDKVSIQNASKVRSQNGLILHIFGKLAAAMVLIFFLNS
jgi:hypothetical protein